MKYHEPDGERYTVLAQSGSDKLIGIINTVLASEARASAPPENARHQGQRGELSRSTARDGGRGGPHLLRSCAYATDIRAGF